jgi:hypothetical protein
LHSLKVSELSFPPAVVPLWVSIFPSADDLLQLAEMKLPCKTVAPSDSALIVLV